MFWTTKYTWKCSIIKEIEVCGWWIWLRNEKNLRTRLFPPARANKSFLYNYSSIICLQSNLKEFRGFVQKQAASIRVQLWLTSSNACDLWVGEGTLVSLSSLIFFSSFFCSYIPWTVSFFIYCSQPQPNEAWPTKWICLIHPQFLGGISRLREKPIKFCEHDVGHLLLATELMSGSQKCYCPVLAITCLLFAANLKKLFPSSRFNERFCWIFKIFTSKEMKKEYNNVNSQGLWEGKQRRPNTTLDLTNVLQVWSSALLGACCQ